MWLPPSGINVWPRGVYAVHDSWGSAQGTSPEKYIQLVNSGYSWFLSECVDQVSTGKATKKPLGLFVRILWISSVRECIRTQPLDSGKHHTQVCAKLKNSHCTEVILPHLRSSRGQGRGVYLYNSFMYRRICVSNPWVLQDLQSAPLKRVDKMAQWVNALVTKADELSLIHGVDR